MHKDAWSYLTSADVARLARGELTPAAIRQAAAAGRLKTAAVTARGTRLFRLDDAQAFLDARNRPRGNSEE